MTAPIPMVKSSAELCLSNWPRISGRERWPKIERIKACLAILDVLLRHLDSSSLCIGERLSESDFLPLDMKSIVLETGMNRRRCTRAIVLLKQLGFVEVHRPQYGHNPKKYAGLRAVRAITPALLDWLQAVRQSENQPGRSDLLLSGVNHESD